MISITPTQDRPATNVMLTANYFEIPVSMQAQLSLYNAKGNLIKNLYHSIAPGGRTIIKDLLKGNVKTGNQYLILTTSQGTTAIEY